MSAIGRDGYGDPDHDDQSAVGVDPPTPPFVPTVTPPAEKEPA